MNNFLKTGIIISCADFNQLNLNSTPWKTERKSGQQNTSFQGYIPKVSYIISTRISLAGV